MKDNMKKFSSSGLPFAFSLLIVFSLVTAYFNLYVAALELAFVLLLFLFIRAGFWKKSTETVKLVEKVLEQNEISVHDSVVKFPLPAAIIEIDTMEITWYNDKFLDIFPRSKNIFETRLNDVIPNFNFRWLRAGDDQYYFDVTLSDKKYKVYGNIVKSEDKNMKFRILAMIYFIDVSEVYEAKKLFLNSKPVVSIIVIDNYDEIMEGVSEAEHSGLVARANQKLDMLAQKTNGILRRMERDRYIFIFEAKFLEEFIKDKFSVLDQVREIESSNRIKLTLSIGVSKDGENLMECYHQANLAVEMAFSRGGDQAVIRHKHSFEFFGGSTKEVEKRTKVKARVKASALRELMLDAKNILIMGHKNADIDSLGAAIGIKCIADQLGVDTHIVIGFDEVYSKALYERISASDEFKDAFISIEDAIISINENTLLIVVDTNRPKYVESQSILEAVNRVVVIDHHRRGADYIDQAVLNIHEPYASSTCELVCEVLNYLTLPSKVSQVAAEALLAGIVLDTKNFSIKTGVRTFEAAAFLRLAGADTVEVKRLFQNDLDSYVLRAEIVSLAKIYKGNIAICEYPKQLSRVIAAQAADELLNISKIDASFVVFLEKDSVLISARSLGDFNVQVILEKLGGGGHLATAGTQIKGEPISQVMEKLKSAIDECIDLE